MSVHTVLKNSRFCLLVCGLLLVSVGCSQNSPAQQLAAAQPGDPIRVLVVTATQGFRHREAIDATKVVLPELAARTELEIEITEDLDALTAENLGRFDVLFIANATLRAEPRENTPAAIQATRTDQVERPVTLAQQQAIVDFVRSGKGLAVAHSGLDAFYGWDEYKEMVGGGLFISHPWTQRVRINVEQPAHPVVAHFGDHFWLHDEIYVLDTNPRSTSTVLLSLDVESAGRADGHRDAQADDYPISWVRGYGDGQVFVTKLGHFGDVWRGPGYLEHILEGIRYAAGRTPAP
jgi:uncharacterized protein